MKREQSKAAVTWGYMAMLTLVWAVMAWFYRSPEVLPLPPGHIHGWRQSDCASLTRNFYEENLPVWEPRVHYAKDDGSGKAVGEFPILNYATAQLMKITGYSWTAQRAVVLLFSWLALMALFLWLRWEFDAGPVAGLLPLLLFTSPVFVYYACNYLPDVPAAALGLCALAADARSRKTDKRRYAVLAVALACLATLVKISAGVIWVVLLGIWALRFWPVSGFNFKATFKKWGGVGLCHLVSGLCTLAWYRYAHAYDFGRKPMIFLTHIRPYWETNPDDMLLINRQIFEVWFPDYFHVSVWYAAGFAFLANLWLTRKNRSLFIINLLVPFGFFAFLLLMYKQLYFHDYYLVVPILAPVLVIAIFVASVWQQTGSRAVKAVVLSVSVGLVVYNAVHAQKIVSYRYFEAVYRDVNYDLINLRPLLREMGIPRTDLMIILPDISPNNSLVLADQYGYSNFMETNGTEADIDRHIRMGAKWLTVADTAYLHNDFLRPFTRDTALIYHQIHVFKLPRQ